MSKDNENIAFFDDLPSQPTAPLGFTHDQMVRCEECLRANPPTRVNCLYCGQALPSTEASIALARPSLRSLESWEQGYNIILLRLPEGEPGEELANQVASFLRLEPSAVQRLFLARCVLPLARASTPEEAALIARRLSELGLEVLIVPDQELQIGVSPPRRLRMMEWDESELVAYQIGSDEVTRLDWAAISLVIVGRLFVTQIELRERKSRKAENQILDASEVSSDDAVLDIYVERQRESWRINAGGFDYSCLGRSKALLAGDNFPALVGRIRDLALSAEFDDSYSALRHSLEVVWPADKRVETGGLRKSRLGRISTGEIITTNSETQFTRYSRLCHYLKRNPLG